MLTAEVFYHTPLAIPFLLPLAIPIGLACQRREQQKRREELGEEFKEMMSSVLTSLRAGYSAENAIRDSCREMAFQYGEESQICRELRRIVHGMDNRIPVENLLQEFAQRSDVEEIREFAEVFAIAKRKGGNMTQILQRTISLIQNRMEVEKEIRVMISSRKMEQLIMDAAPFVIILYIKATSPGFFDILYGNTAGVLIMTCCLAAYSGALVLSEKIMDIRV